MCKLPAILECDVVCKFLCEKLPGAWVLHTPKGWTDWPLPEDMDEALERLCTVVGIKVRANSLWAVGALGASAQDRAAAAVMV